MEKTAARQAQADYKKAYRERNKEKLNAYQKEWFSREENKGKRAEYQKNYWQKKALKAATEVSNAD